MTPASASRPRPVVLCILDGWGWRESKIDNAIAQAGTPTWDRLLATCPHALVETSGLEVGLPDGQMGNSEVGHTNLGAGRVVMQELPRLDQAAADGSLARNPTLVAGLAAIKARGGRLHLLGLLSPGGVHSHQDHMAALAKAASAAGVPVIVHAFLDGRDTPPQSAKGFLEKFLADVKGFNVQVGVVSGRYYAMDRDKRWDRVSLAYAAMVEGKGLAAPGAVAAVTQGYGAGTNDEFVMPTVIAGYDGMQDGDGLLMANFRADRAREILHALADPAFDGFARTKVANFSAKLGLTEYSEALGKIFQTLFPAHALANILGEVVSRAGMTQLRIAETEKYAHVTFFFNGGEEKVFPGEERILVPSPKVATYDLKPEMSAPEVTDRLVEAIGSGKFDLIVANFANGDMVGHTGMMEAAMQAARTIDSCLARLEAAILKAGGALLVTADHGNAELMRDQETGQPHTAHTTGPVQTILVNGPAGLSLSPGRLADIAPTLLALLDLPQPADMTGRSLLLPVDTRRAQAG
jgi:2,3-bisphosphoglycerate-independent phosphoglycerate mutase